MRLWVAVLASIFTLSFASVSQAALRLTPQSVVDLTLQRGLRAKDAELTAQRSYINLQRALGVYDFKFSFKPSYEYSEAQNLSGNSNIIDRTTNIEVAAQKTFSTGSTLTLSYLNQQQNSTLPITATRTSNIALNAVQVELRQSLWRNSFGYADRLLVDAGNLIVENALETREEDLETILLDAMVAFWNSYIAERQLAENISAREKYEQLVRSVRRKAGFNLSTPGELPRLEAEMQLAEQRVKASSANYLNAVSSLLTTIRVQTADKVELIVPPELPPVPVLKPKDVEQLRYIRTARRSLEVAEKNVSITKNQNRPQLDLVGRARSTGVEERNSEAVAEMQGGSKPTYYVGLEFQTPFGSALQRGLEADAEVQRLQVENAMTLRTETIRGDLLSYERSVTAQFAVAKSAIETVELRGRVVRDMEAAYRQGRQPLVELIRSYNDLFTAQLEKARAVGQYHINLNTLAAARDELVANVAR